MKLAGAAINRFLSAPNPDVCVVLLYGPDHGLVSERAKLLESRHLGDNPGPFSQSILTDADLKADPAALQDSLCALSLGGGERVVRVKTGADAIAKTLKALLEALKAKELSPAALLLVEAGNLSPRSALRKCVETNKAHAVALPCYAPNFQDLKTLALEEAKTNDLSFGEGALDFLINRLPQDRAIAGAEIEKLMLYKANEQNAAIQIDDINAINVDSLDQGLDDFAFAIAGGALPVADRLLAGALAAGQSPIALLRALQRHLFRLVEAKTALNNGMDEKTAMASLRPPVFFPKQAAFSRQLGRWSAPKIQQAIAHCLATERAMKSSGSMPDNLLARLAIKIGAAQSRAN